MDVNNKNPKSSLPKSLKIITRKVLLKGVNNKPRYWHHNDPFMSHLLNAGSLFLPEGERFFIRSFQYFQDAIKDEQLSQEIRQFIAQEAVHGHEHTRFNQDLIDNQGYAFMEKSELRIKSIFAFYNRFTSKKFQLAITLGLEHFTAIIADMLLRHPQFMKGVDPEYQEIWQWHLMEELEHKGVAMDIYNAVDGSYWKRVLAITLSLFSIVPYLGYVFVRLLWTDGVFTKELWQKQKEYHRGNSPAFVEIWNNFKSFFKKGFHPWEHDNSNLVLQFNKYFYDKGVIKDIPKYSDTAVSERA